MDNIRRMNILLVEPVIYFQSAKDLEQEELNMLIGDVLWRLLNYFVQI